MQGTNYKGNGTTAKQLDACKRNIIRVVAKNISCDCNSTNQSIFWEDGRLLQKGMKTTMTWVNDFFKKLDSGLGLLALAIFFSTVNKLYDSMDNRLRTADVRTNEIHEIETEIELRLWYYAQGINALIDTKPVLSPTQARKQLSELLEATENPKKLGIPELEKYNLSVLFTKLASFYDIKLNESQKNLHDDLIRDRHGWRNIEYEIKKLNKYPEDKLGDMPMTLIEFQRREISRANPFKNWIIRKPIESFEHSPISKMLYISLLCNFILILVAIFLLVTILRRTRPTVFPAEGNSKRENPSPLPIEISSTIKMDKTETEIIEPCSHADGYSEKHLRR